jgi:hypothetical protein
LGEFSPVGRLFAMGNCFKISISRKNAAFITEKIMAYKVWLKCAGRRFGSFSSQTHLVALLSSLVARFFVVLDTKTGENVQINTKCTKGA